MTAMLLLEFVVIVGFLTTILLWVVITRNPGKRWTSALAWVLVFITFDLVVFGAFTRLTDSGLGCPDWPGCYEKATPWAAKHEISQAMLEQPTGPVSHTKAWIEMIHRFIAMTVGLMTILLLVLTFIEKKPRRVQLASIGLLLLILLQGAFGAWTVTLKLQPIVVTGHLFFGILFLGAAALFAYRYTANQEYAKRFNVVSLPSQFSTMSLIFICLLFVQVILGGWVSSNYAVMACQGFPQCNGQWVPEMNFQQGFTLIRPLHALQNGEPISPQALTAIHYTHRLFALVVVVYGLLLAWRLRLIDRKSMIWLSGLLLMQVGTGIANVVFGWPLLAAIIHSAGASMLLLLSLNIYVRSTRTQQAENLSC